MGGGGRPPPPPPPPPLPPFSWLSPAVAPPPARRCLWLHHQRRGPHRCSDCLGSGGGRRGFEGEPASATRWHLAASVCSALGATPAPVRHAAPPPFTHPALPPNPALPAAAGRRARQGSHGCRVQELRRPGVQLCQGGAAGQRGSQAGVTHQSVAPMGGAHAAHRLRGGSPCLRPGSRAGALSEGLAHSARPARWLPPGPTCDSQ